MNSWSRSSIKILGLSSLCVTTLTQADVAQRSLKPPLMSAQDVRMSFLESLDSSSVRASSTVGWRGSIPSLDEMIPRDLQVKIQQRKLRAHSSVMESKGATVRSAVDLRVRDTPIRTQFGGTCTAFGMVAAMENFLGLPSSVDLSEAHLWNSYQAYQLEPAVKAALGRRLTEEAYWPQDNSLPYARYLTVARTRLMGIRALEDNVAEAIRALNRNHPVYLGLSVQTDLQGCRPTVRADSPLTGGAHALAAVGYRYDPQISGGGYFILKNSWGASCGDHGYQYLPFAACRRTDMFCLMWELTSVTRQ